MLAALILQILGAATRTIDFRLLIGGSAFHPLPFARSGGPSAGALGARAFVSLYIGYEYSHLRIHRLDFAKGAGSYAGH